MRFSCIINLKVNRIVSVSYNIYLTSKESNKSILVESKSFSWICESYCPSPVKYVEPGPCIFICDGVDLYISTALSLGSFSDIE